MLEENVKEKLSQLDTMIGHRCLLYEFIRHRLLIPCIDPVHIVVYPEANGGPFIAGSSITVVDCFAAGVLYHFQCAVGHLKGKTFEGHFAHVGLPHLQTYMMTLTTLPEYQHGVLLYTADDVLYGWRTARSEI